MVNRAEQGLVCVVFIEESLFEGLQEMKIAPTTYPHDVFAAVRDIFQTDSSMIDS